MIDDYPIVIFRDDGEYVADVPDPAYCSAHGETPKEALREARRTKRTWLEVARQRDLPIPEATRHPTLARAS